MYVARLIQNGREIDIRSANAMAHQIGSMMFGGFKCIERDIRKRMVWPFWKDGVNHVDNAGKRAIFLDLVSREMWQTERTRHEAVLMVQLILASV